ncbi:hypothetical protein Pmani_013168 [Petrolisthes manimaculis]|uniref:Uncharacterized protein n=1 Tax=Petrolisthes manimaculis TaxID=1843537 RepID=A0AAE1UEC0_9EUCA|nr:hypothetical protein Pmani_013168 [Petrolisthes manimaculis]
MAVTLRSSSVLLATFLVLTVSWESALTTTLAIPPYLQYFLRHLHQYERLSPSRRFLKRNDIFSANEASPSRSFHQVETGVLGKYILTPDAIINTTQLLQEGVDCSSLQVTTHKNHFVKDPNLRPTWLHNSIMIGMCPTKYVNRTLHNPQDHRPDVVLEAQCICDNSQCSRDGAKCVALKYQMKVLKIISKDRNYTKDNQEITLACVCARNPSRYGGYIENNAEVF